MGRHSETQTFNYTSSGTKTAFTCDEPGIRLFQIHGSWTTLLMKLQGSILGVVWVDIESTISAASGFLNFAPWPLYRVVITTLTGVGANVNVDFLVEKQLRQS